MLILFTTNEYCIACVFSALGWHLSYEWRATTSKLSLNTLHNLVRTLQKLLFMYSGHDMYSQAMHTRTKECVRYMLYGDF